MSSGPFLCYKELLSPTIIDHAVFFSTYNENNVLTQYLLTSSINTLRIYNTGVTASNSSNINENHSHSGSQSKIVLIYQDFVYGRIQDLKVYSKSKYTRTQDVILISFDDGKFVSFEYNPLDKSMNIISLLNIEENAIGIGASNMNLFRYQSHIIGIGSIPILAIDSNNGSNTNYGLAASIIHGKYILFFDLYEKSVSQSTSNSTAEANSKQSFGGQFIIDPQQSLELYGPILDLCFVSGYSRPVLALLIDSGPLPFGHVAKVRYTCTIALLAVDHMLKTVSLLWKRTEIPHDSFKILPLVSSKYDQDCGVILFSMNGILSVKSSDIYGIGVNSFAAATMHPSHSISISGLDIALELDSSNWMLVDSSAYIGALKDGTIIVIHFSPSSSSLSSSSSSLSSSYNNNKAKMSISIVGMSIVSSCICCSSLSGNLWFFGSIIQEALFFKVHRSEFTHVQNNLSTNTITPVKRELYENSMILSIANSSALSTPYVSSTNKRQRRLSKPNLSIPSQSTEMINGTTDMSALVIEMEAEEMELYGSILDREYEIGFTAVDVISSNTLFNYKLEVLDRIPVIAAIHSGTFSRSDNILDQIDSVQLKNIVDGTSQSTHHSILSKQSPASYIAEFEAKDSVLFTAGVNTSAAIYRVSNGIRLAKIATRTYGAVISIATITDSNLSWMLLFLSYDNSTKVFRMTYNSSNNINYSTSHSQKVNSMDFNENDQLISQELTTEVSACVVNQRTISVGLISTSHMVQIYESGLRLIKLSQNQSISTSNNENEALQDMILRESEELGGLAGVEDDLIIEGCVDQGYAAVITKHHWLYVIKYDKKEDMMMIEYIRKYPIGDNYDQNISKNDNMDMNTENIWSICPTSISFYTGLLSFSSNDNSTDSNHCQIKSKNNIESSSLSTVELEEIYLYGSTLHDSTKEGSYEHKTNETEDMNVNMNVDMDMDSHGFHSSSHSISSNKIATYLLMVDRQGTLFILSVESHLQIECKISTLGEKLNVIYPILSNQFQLEPIYSFHPPIDSSSSILVSAMLAQVGPMNQLQNTKMTGLCLVGMLSTGDFVVYEAIVSNQMIIKFTKCKHSHLLNNRNIPATKRTIKQSNGNYSLHNHLSYIHDINGLSAIAISGAHPAIVTIQSSVDNFQNTTGFVSIMSLGLPELPFSNYGIYNLVALCLSNTVRGIVSLWTEKSMDDNTTMSISSTGSLSHTKRHHPHHQQQSIVGFYQDIPSLQFYPTSYSTGSVSVKKISASGTTIHHIIEISRAKVEDKTELQLLENKLLVTSCSQDVSVPFRPDVLTETEIAHMESDFAYYFSDLTSWFQPSDPNSIATILANVSSSSVVSSSSILPSSSSSPSYMLSMHHHHYHHSNPFNSRIMNNGQNVNSDIFSPNNANQLPNPNILDRQFRIALLQGGTVIDEYYLSENERILDMEVVYANIEPSLVVISAADRRKGVIPTQPAPSVKRTMIIVGTCMADKHGEDCPSDGRLLLFALDYIRIQPVSINDGMGLFQSNHTTTVSSTSSSLTSSILQPKLKLLSAAVGPASIVRQFSNNRILSTIGPQIAVYRFQTEVTSTESSNNNTSSSSSVVLDQISFYYAKFYITSVTIVKNFIYIADASNRVELLVWRDEDWSLTLISKDYGQPSISRAIAVINDGTSIATIVSDDEMNIQLLQFDPRREVESIQGAKLLCIGDFHCGNEITTLLSHPTLSYTIQNDTTNENSLQNKGFNSSNSNSSNPNNTSGNSNNNSNIFRPNRFGHQSGPVFGSRLIKSSQQRSSVLVGTMDGSIGAFIPVEERVFKRLNLLQQLMSISLESSCALNPKDYRTFKSLRFRLEKKKCVLDGTMLWRYVSLPTSLQIDLAAAMGTSVDIILGNLYDLNMLLQFF